MGAIVYYKGKRLPFDYTKLIRGLSMGCGWELSANFAFFRDSIAVTNQAVAGLHRFMYQRLWYNPLSVERESFFFTVPVRDGLLGHHNAALYKDIHDLGITMGGQEL